MRKSLREGSPISPSQVLPPFASLVKDSMEARGLGLRELCREAELDPSFLSKVLAGKRNPPSDEDVLRRIAVVLELDPARLISSAGRIPSEWARLYSDDYVFDKVDSLLRGRRAPAPPPSRPDDFGDELL